MSQPISPADLLRRLHWRYSTKRFDAARAIPEEVWQALEDSLVLAPSSFGLQPWKFVVVDTPELRQRLRAASWNQAQVTDAPKFVVFCGKRTLVEADVDRYLKLTSEVRSIPIDSLAGYRKVIVKLLTDGWTSRDLGGWNARQVYIGLGQFLAAAAMLGVDTSALEGIDTAAYDDLLGLERTDFTSLCACAAGYRSDTDKYATAPKVRYKKAEIIERR